MKQIKSKCIADSKCDVVYPIYSDQAVEQSLCETLGYDVNEVINKEFGKTTKVYTLGTYPFSAILFVGLGEAKEMEEAKLRKAWSTAIAAMDGDVTFYPASALTDTIDVKAAVQTFVEMYGIVSHKETKVGSKKAEAKNVFVLTEAEQADKWLADASIVVKGVNHARDLGNAPANLMTADDLAAYAENLAKTYGMRCETLDKKALVEMKAGALLAVNQGSAMEPKMIVLRYNGAGDEPYTALIGKGLIFDTGGYNIKPNSLGMKYDMCGGATVLGAMEIIAGLKLKANVLCVVPTTDNMIDGSAYKPDDVITSLSGKTIEVLNTDAEGRIILADAITYAQRLGAKQLIDVATLTGAVIVALGNEITGGFSNDQAYYDRLKAVAEASNEQLWQMPTGTAFIEQLTDTTSADIKNIAMNGAGSSIGAAFLQYFLEAGTKWIHLDIAGSATAKSGPIVGATGSMVRTLANLFR